MKHIVTLVYLGIFSTLTLAAQPQTRSRPQSRPSVRPTGPIYTGPVKACVPEKGIKTHEFQFKKGIPLVISVTGDGESDLDMFVLDKKGVEVVKDASYNIHPIVTFTPTKTQLYTLKITNSGIINCYTLFIE